MLKQFGLSSLLVVAACSSDPKPEEPVAATSEAATGAAEQPAAEAAVETVNVAAVEPEAKPVAPTPAPTPPVIAVKISGKVGAKEPTKPAAAKGDTFWVFVDDANVRGAPSLGAKIVGKLKWGDKLTGTSATNGFVKIGEGQFVHRRMLTDRKKRFGQEKAAH